MKHVCIITLCLLSALQVFAQKEDYIWVIGHDQNFNDSIFGGTVINFNNNETPDIEYYEHNVNMNMYVSNASVCDTSGNLLFYSNGCNIADENGKYVTDGTEINPGYWHTRLCDEIARGYTAGYPSMVILPQPDHDSLYYLFHKSVKYVQGPPEDAFVDKLLYSIIKVTVQGKVVVQKNVPLMEDNLAAGEMLAVKHANGKDWWLITPKRNSNQFYVFLFTAEGIVDTLTQTIGDLPPAEEEASGQNNFNTDGSLMVRYYPYHPAMLYDFDRATGLFSNYRTVNIDFGTAWAWDGGSAFSPSGRFLYIAALKRIYQFDLWADDISATQTTVAEWDGFISPIATNFYTCQLGPDCKIYIIAGGDTRYYHIIHNPDEPGLACNVEQHGLVLPTPSGASIPYFPNYRLGPIDNPGQPCTPTVSAAPGIPLNIPQLSAWPNPAIDQVTIEWKEAAQGKVNISLYDVYGRKVKSLAVSGINGQYTLAIGDLPNGLYRCAVMDTRSNWRGWTSVLVAR